MKTNKIIDSEENIGITTDIENWLNDTEITLTHRNVTKIGLDQILLPLM
jgi:hypothetical protein